MCFDQLHARRGGRPHSVVLGEHDVSREDETNHVIIGVKRLIGLDCTKLMRFSPLSLILRWIKHRRYNPRTTNNDFALLELETPVNFQKYRGTIEPVCLPKEPIVNKATVQYETVSW